MKVVRNSIKNFIKNEFWLLNFQKQMTIIKYIIPIDLHWINNCYEWKGAEACEESYIIVKF